MLKLSGKVLNKVFLLFLLQQYLAGHLQSLEYSSYKMPIVILSITFLQETTILSHVHVKVGLG